MLTAATGMMWCRGGLSGNFMPTTMTSKISKRERGKTQLSIAVVQVIFDTRAECAISWPIQYFSTALLCLATFNNDLPIDDTSAIGSGATGRASKLALSTLCGQSLLPKRTRRERVADCADYPHYDWKRGLSDELIRAKEQRLRNNEL